MRDYQRRTSLNVKIYLSMMAVGSAFALFSVLTDFLTPRQFFMLSAIVVPSVLFIWLDDRIYQVNSNRDGLIITQAGPLSIFSGEKRREIAFDTISAFGKVDDLRDLVAVGLLDKRGILVHVDREIVPIYSGLLTASAEQSLLDTLRREVGRAREIVT